MAEIDIARKVVEAWEALPGGRNYSMKVVESWLTVHMAPMVNEMRSLIDAGPSSAPTDLSVGGEALFKIARIILAEAPADATEWRDVSLDSIRFALAPSELSVGCKFSLGDRVLKMKGSSWQGRVVGFYSTELTPIGYAVESEREPGSVQIYPETALAKLEDQP
jgi:hypothetical protein